MIKRIVTVAFALALAVTTQAYAETANGTWSLQTVNGQTYLDMRYSDGLGHHESESGHDINTSDYGISNIGSVNGHVTFKNHRDAGDFVFDGWLKDGDGGGTYVFTPNDGFFGELTRRGYDVSDIGRKMTFANLDITMAYVNSIEAAGYHVDANKLVTFKALKIDQQYLQDMKSAGISDLSENQIVSLKALKVDLAYIRDLDSVGFGHMSAHDYVTFKALKIDSAYIKYLTAHGFKNLTPNQVVTMKAMKV